MRHSPVRALDPVEDRVVDVQLRVVVAAVVLEERRDDELVGVDPSPGRGRVVADPGVAGLVLERRQRRGVARPDRVLDRVAVRCPGVGRDGVARASRGNLLRLERGVHDGDRLRHGVRRVDERHRRPCRMPGGEPDLLPALGCRVRLGGQHVGDGVAGRGVPAWRTAEAGGFAPPVRLAESIVTRVHEVAVERLHVLVVDLTGQAEAGGAAALPSTGWFAGGDRSGVVALPALRDRPGQVLRRVAGGQRDHRRSPASADADGPSDCNALVCTAARRLVDLEGTSSEEGGLARSAGFVDRCGVAACSCRRRTGLGRLPRS